MVMRRKKDSKVISKCSRAFFKGVRISVSRVSEYMPSTAEVTKKGMNDDIREDARQGVTLPETNPERYVRGCSTRERNCKRGPIVEIEHKLNVIDGETDV